MTTTAQMEATVETLVPLAKLIYRERDAMTLEIKVIINEVSCLFDALTGIPYTNPEERARHHVEVLDRLVNELPTVGIKPSHPEGSVS